MTSQLHTFLESVVAQVPAHVAAAVDGDVTVVQHEHLLAVALLYVAMVTNLKTTTTTCEVLSRIEQTTSRKLRWRKNM